MWSPEGQVTVTTPTGDRTTSHIWSLFTNDLLSQSLSLYLCGLGQPPGERLTTHWALPCWLTNIPLNWLLPAGKGRLLGLSRALECASLWLPLWSHDFERTLPPCPPASGSMQAFFKEFFFIFLFSSPLSLVQISKSPGLRTAIQSDCVRHSCAPKFPSRCGTSLDGSTEQSRDHARFPAFHRHHHLSHCPTRNPLEGLELLLCWCGPLVQGEE